MIGRGDFREIADSFGLAASIKPFGFVVLPLGAGAGAVAAWVGPVASCSSRRRFGRPNRRRHGKSRVSFGMWRRLTTRCSRCKRGVQSIVNCWFSAAAFARLSFVR